MQGAWGYALFQSDRDLDEVGDLSHDAGLDKVKRKILANPSKYAFKDDKTQDENAKPNKDIYLTLYQPSHPDLVQEYLNDGVLLRMINDLRNKGKGYSLCILIACAMQLGCNIPDWCRQELLLVYKKCHLPPEGEIQLHSALQTYRSGVPHPFCAKSLIETANSGNPSYDEEDVIFMNLENVPSGEEVTQQNTSIEPLEGDFNHPVDTCGNCGARQCQDGTILRRCAGCKERLYCSKFCQKAHTPNHSCFCQGFKKFHEDPPTDACGNCGTKTAKDGSNLKRCGRCMKILYCSVECQKVHHSVHSPKCKAIVKSKRREEEREKQKAERVKAGGPPWMGMNVLQTWL